MVLTVHFIFSMTKNKPMHLYKLLLSIFFSIVTFNWYARANESHPLALMYNGPGVCDGCAESLAVLVSKAGYDVRYVRPEDLTEENFNQAALFVHPGGSDRMEDTLEEMSPKSIQRIRKFVFNGGRYLGVCAGGYLAGTWTDDSHQTNAFGLIPGNVSEEDENSDSQLKSVVWKNRLVHVYYQAGPYFNIDKIPDADVWAYYKKSHHVAAFMASFGKGHIGLIGPHPEADQEWLDDDDLKSPDGVHLDLGIQFIRALQNR
nr:BPL-N domain-containing protein [uncultured Bdellovibrio sp.]